MESKRTIKRYTREKREANKSGIIAADNFSFFGFQMVQRAIEQSNYAIQVINIAEKWNDLHFGFVSHRTIAH